jgi:hypothetical protein
MSSSKIKDRIRKLRSLSQSSNPHEAEAAAEAARKLMNAHQLTETDLDISQGGRFFEKAMGADGFLAPWKFALVTDVAQWYGCEAVGLRQGARRKVRIVGLRSEVEAAAAHFERLLVDVHRLSQSERNHPPRQVIHELVLGLLDSMVYMDSFRQGVVLGISDHLRGPVMADFSASVALVRKPRNEVRDYMRSQYPRTKEVDLDAPGTEQTRQWEVDKLALMRGYFAGASLESQSRRGRKD